MFPTPVAKTSQLTQWLYAAALPVALFLWLLPLLGVALTSVRPASDLGPRQLFRHSLDLCLEQLCRHFSQHAFVEIHPQFVLS